jgi:hypothetical protein
MLFLSHALGIDGGVEFRIKSRNFHVTTKHSVPHSLAKFQWSAILQHDPRLSIL